MQRVRWHGGNCAAPQQAMNKAKQITTTIPAGLPPAQRHIIKRPRLTKLLDEAEARVILLVAPAGYGKTTLAREWTTQRGRTALSYSARMGASDVSSVARGLAHALAPVAAGAEKTVREFLVAHPEPEADALASLLADEIGAWPAGTWLVIDEYELLIGNDSLQRCVEVLVNGSDANVLIASRERPSWVSSRDLLYGEVFELRRATLAMTFPEATQVLEHAPHAPAGVVALADGWPVVIGLAALLSGEVELEQDVQIALFDYLAQELFAGLDAVVQRQLVLLSVPSMLTPSVVHAVCGDDADLVLRESIHAGLVAIRDGQELEIHPLCRAFLMGKLPGIGVDTERIDALVEHLVTVGQWDDAFEVIRRFELVGQFPLLLTRGLRGALTEGREGTVDDWIRWAEQRGLEAPVMSLARAEIYLRRGAWQLSEEFALSCARSTDSTEIAAQAHLCAGTAARLLDDGRRAYGHYSNALANNDSAVTRRKALWGRFLASFDADLTANHDALLALEQAADTAPEHLLRVHQARLHVASREGDMSNVAAAALAMEPLLQHIDDPMVRSGFMNVLADQLSATSRYKEAERLAALEVAESERFHLAFVLPFALVNLAAAKLGLGAYTTAATLLERAEREDRTQDDFLRMKREVTRARLYLSRGDARAALELLRRLTLEGVRSDVAGEALATAAVAHACLADEPRARLKLDSASPLASDITTQVFVAATNAILGIRDGGDALAGHLEALAQTVFRTGNFDGALCALRAEPALLRLSAEHPSMREVIRVLVARSADTSLVGALGDPVDRPRMNVLLSRREGEVLALAAQGFRNGEIGQRLFISPKTVKTHLQNVYEKLEVNSRTEAVVKARDAGLLS